MILSALLALSVYAAVPQKALEPSAPAAIPSLPSPVIVPKPGDAWLSRDVDRNQILQALADAGASQYFNEQGLSLWRAAPFQARGRQRVQLTFAAFDAKESESALASRLQERAAELASWIFDKTRIAEDDVIVQAKPLSECCGARCGDCLRSKKGPSRHWTRPSNKI